MKIIDIGHGTPISTPVSQATKPPLSAPVTEPFSSVSTVPIPMTLTPMSQLSAVQDVLTRSSVAQPIDQAGLNAVMGNIVNAITGYNHQTNVIPPAQGPISPAYTFVEPPSQPGPSVRQQSPAPALQVSVERSPSIHLPGASGGPSLQNQTARPSLAPQVGPKSKYHSNKSLSKDILNEKSLKCDVGDDFGIY